MPRLLNQQSKIDNFSLKRDYYLRHVPVVLFLRYISSMSYGTGPAKYRCAQCEQPEDSCQCEKFCCLCQSVLDIRICNDSLMYCEACRTACGYKTSSD
jgi:hypothetical protein